MKVAQRKSCVQSTYYDHGGVIHLFFSSWVFFFEMDVMVELFPHKMLNNGERGCVVEGKKKCPMKNEWQDSKRSFSVR